MMTQCERLPPEGWPGGPCPNVATFDVLYRLRTEHEPRGIRVCLRHLEEMKELQRRQMFAEWDARTIR